MSETTTSKQGLPLLSCLSMFILACALLVPASPARAQEEKPKLPIIANNDQWFGEPYALAGNRLMFTSWYYVRPGGFRWVNKQGEMVGADPKAKIGPWDSNIEKDKESPRGVRIIAEPAQRHGIFIPSEKPWEAMGLSVFWIMKEKELYRGWALSQDAQGKRYYSIFESDDGLKWKRPEVGLIEYDGNKSNNLITTPPMSIFIDPNGPPEERYKGAHGDTMTIEEFNEFKAKHPDRWQHQALRHDNQTIVGVRGWVSPDGLTWKKGEMFAVEHSDTQIIGGYIPYLKRYLIFTRTWWDGPQAKDPTAPRASDASWMQGRRSIGYTESDHFGDFPMSTNIIVPRSDMTGTQLLYTNCYTTLPGAPDHHVLFPTVWDISDDTCHLEMMASDSDAHIWNWVPGGALAGTANFGEFDGGCIFWHPNLTELKNGDWALPYTGYAFPHKYPRGAWSYRPGYSVWPKGRLTALEAEGEGQFTTAAIIPPGKKLRINAVTKRAGEIRVAVMRRDGKIIDSRTWDDAVPIIGDQHWTEVKWKAADTLGNDNGEAICLRFKMTQAKIYGLEFE